jgi:hypothetical protein
LHFQISFQDTLYKAIGFTVVSYEYEAWYVIVSEEHELQVYESKICVKIFELKKAEANLKPCQMPSNYNRQYQFFNVT